MSVRAVGAVTTGAAYTHVSPRKNQDLGSRQLRVAGEFHEPQPVCTVGFPYLARGLSCGKYGNAFIAAGVYALQSPVYRSGINRVRQRARPRAPYESAFH